MHPVLALTGPLELYSTADAQRALLAVLLLAVISAALGWAVNLRDLPFFTHATGAGAWPLLVAGLLLGVSTAVSALAGALIFALLLAVLSRPGTASAADSGRRDVLVGLLVVAAIAIGSTLATRAPAGNELAHSPEALLFGSLLALDTAALLLIALTSLVVCLLAVFCFERWLAAGFDPEAVGGGGARLSELLLLVAVALAVGAAMPTIGALLAGAFLIVPAASVRLFSDRARLVALLTFPLAAVVAVVGLTLALEFELAPGATIAAVAAAVFFLAAGLRRLRAFGARPLAVPAALFVSVLLLAGCGSSAPSSSVAEDPPLEVAASTPQVAQIVEAVGGEAVRVQQLMPRGAKSAGFEPSAQALDQLKKASVIFRSGAGSDEWLQPALDEAGITRVPVDLSRAVMLQRDSSGEIDPRWQRSAQNVSRALQRVRDELVKADPEARETFRANADQVIARCDQSSTDKEGLACLAAQ